MATIKYLLTGIVLFFMLGLGSCTQYNYIDGGHANGVHDCTMWEYFHKDSYNWDSVILMIERADMRSVFDGTGQYPEITFFGPVNLSIERHIQNHNKGLKPTDAKYWHGVKDIPVSQCRDILQKLVVPLRFMRKEVPRGTRIQETVEGMSVWKQTGGMICDCLRGRLFVWTEREIYQDIDDTGAFTLWISSQNQQGTECDRIASTDIQTTNGVVHSMNNDFRFVNF